MVFMQVSIIWSVETWQPRVTSATDKSIHRYSWKGQVHHEVCCFSGHCFICLAAI